MRRQCRLRRAATNWHRHAIEQASRRWRGGRRGDSARTRRKILISTQVCDVEAYEAWRDADDAVSEAVPGKIKALTQTTEFFAYLDTIDDSDEDEDEEGDEEEEEDEMAPAPVPI